MKRLGLFASAFDPFVHPGYSYAWRQAIDADLCDGILAALHVDPNCERLEKRRPALSVRDREQMLFECKHVHIVVRYTTEAELVWIAHDFRPSVIIVGEDHRHDPVTGAGWAPVFYARRRPEWSGTIFTNAIYEAERDRREHATSPISETPRDQDAAGDVSP